MPKIVDHNEMHRELCATTVRLIATKGLDNTSLRSIAIAHKCTKGMVQHYCESKQNLLEEAWATAEKARVNRIATTGNGLAGLELLQARLMAQLPSTEDITYEWRVRLAFCAAHSMSDEMCAIQVAQRKTRIREGVACLRVAHKFGKIKSDLNLRDVYHSLDSLVTGLAIAAVMEQGGLSDQAQRNILKAAIDNLRC